MHKPSAPIVLFVLLVLSWVGYLSDIPSVAQDTAASTPMWRYRSKHDQDDLRRLGEEGWEAYAVTHSPPTAGARYFLKKRIQ
jgi:hypothetical protein